MLITIVVSTRSIDSNISFSQRFVRVDAVVLPEAKFGGNIASLSFEDEVDSFLLVAGIPSTSTPRYGLNRNVREKSAFDAAVNLNAITEIVV